MNAEKILFVRNILFQQLSPIFEMREATEVINAIIIDVVADIEDTADENFNSSDICIALQRVLYNKIVG
jgi:hypothetical protein